MDLSRWRPDRHADRRWRWVAIDLLAAYTSATIPIGESDATASVLHGPPVARVAAVVWFAAIAGRRFAPAAALWGAAAATAAMAVAGLPLTNLSAASALALTMVAQTRPRPRAVALSVPPALVALAALAAQDGEALVLGAVLHGVAWAVGASSRSRWETARMLRTHEEERAAASRERALADERARLARELHDAVGHAVTVMVTHAGAARLALGGEHPDVRSSLRRIEDTGRAAMADLDQVLGLLAADGPPPDLADALRTLVDGLPAGLTADLSVDGDITALEEPVRRALYRAAQEALTNVVRHASATTVRITLSRNEEEITLHVSNDGTAAPPHVPGRGLTGMRERVERLGGTCHAGPAPGGGWRVEVRVLGGPA
ncbi:sensor histidine kinase [Spirillospora sp. CA-255316]